MNEVYNLDTLKYSGYRDLRKRMHGQNSDTMTCMVMLSVKDTVKWQWKSYKKVIKREKKQSSVIETAIYKKLVIINNDIC